MAAIIRMLSRRYPNVEIDTLYAIIAFCGAGLLVSLLCAAYGLDLSTGFF